MLDNLLGNTITWMPDGIRFFSKDFNVYLKLHKHGGVEGELMHLQRMIAPRHPIEGLYVEDDRGLRLSFFMQWDDLDRSQPSLTAFTGEIINYMNSSLCLILRWSGVHEFTAPRPPRSCENYSVLLDSPTKSLEVELSKIPVDLIGEIALIRHSSTIG